jgi:GMP reductase
MAFVRWSLTSTMTQVLDGIKFGFEDVRIIPKRSEAISRKDIDLRRTFDFKWGEAKWEGIPIVASNISYTCTMDMAKALASHHMLTAISKHVDAKTIFEAYSTDGHFSNHVFYTIGMQKDGLWKFFDFLQMMGVGREDFSGMLCIDVANGYTDQFSTFVKDVREVT